jgi:hypothetical protein
MLVSEQREERGSELTVTYVLHLKLI